MDIKKIKVDSAVIEAGEWVSDLPEMGDLKLKVRGEDNEAFKKYMNKRLRSVPKGARNRDGTLPPAVLEALTGEAYLETVLIDWDNLRDGDTPITYDKELARTFLTDKDYRDFFGAVRWAAQNVARAKSEVDEGILGNSAPPSNGSKAGAATPKP